MTQEHVQEYPPFVCSDGAELAVNVRLSKKARNQRVVFHYQGCVELVIPTRMRGAARLIEPKQVATFLEEKRTWIERVARRAAPAIDSYRESLAAGLPTHLDFLALGELWAVEYHATAAARITLKQSAEDAGIVLHGPIENEELCFEALRRFVSAYAKEQLPLFAWRIIGELEAAGQLPRRPAAITVNRRKSAWGVCTQDGRIRIDQRVIFLPYDLARQIVLHEIAHLSHLNHQQAFYEELYSYDGSSREAEKSVKQAARFVPAWF